MTLIVSLSWKDIIKITLLCFGILTLISFYVFFRYSVIDDQPLDSGFWYVVALAFSTMILTIFIFNFFGGRGKKLEVDLNGINIGKRYFGPVKNLKEINVYKFSKLNKDELRLLWKDINKIYSGIFDRKWFAETPTWATIIPGSKAEKRMVGRYIIIEKKNGDIFAIEVMLYQLNKFKEELINLNKNILIDPKEYKF